MVLDDPEGMAFHHQFPKQIQNLFRLALRESKAGLVKEEETWADGFRPGEPTGQGDTPPLAQGQVSPPLPQTA